MADIKFLVQVDTATGKAALKEFEGSIEKMGDSGKRGEGALKGMFGQVFAGVTVANLAQKALGLFKDVIAGLPAAAMEEERAQRALEAALQTTGRTLPGLARHFDALASALQKQTVYDDEAIKGAETLLLQLTNLDKNGIERATKGAIGLASVMGMDLQGAATLVAKAMEGNYSALSRVGIKVNESLSDDQKKISLLSQLERMYGRATADTDTMAGRLAQLRNAWDDVKAALGKFLTGNEAAKVSLEALKTVLENLPAIIKKFENSFTSIVNSMPILRGFVQSLILLALAAKSAGVEAERSRRGWDFFRDAIFAAGDSAGGASPPTKEYTKALTDLATRGMSATKREAYEIIQQMKVVASEFKAGRISADEYHQVMTKLQGQLRKVGAEDYTTWLKKIRDEMKKNKDAARQWLIDDQRKHYAQAAEDLRKHEEEKKAIHQKAREWLDKNRTDWLEKEKTRLNELKEANIRAFQDILGAAGGVFSSLAALSDAHMQKKMQDLELEYAARKSAIEQMKMSEEDRVAALAKLDEEFAAKRAAARKEAGAKSKAWSIWEATINTAQAITAALATKPFFPLGIIMAALAAAQGAIQIAAIKAQPVPMAKGGILTQRVFSATGEYEAGEAGPEAVIPISEKAKQNFNLALERRGGGGRPIALTIPIYVGGRKVDEQIIEIVNQGSIDGRVKMRRRSMAN